MGSEDYMGAISTFAGNYAPHGYTNCDGKLLNISQFQALFAIIGTTYGGDGRTTFGIPDLRPVKDNKKVDWAEISTPRQVMAIYGLWPTRD